MITYDIVGRWRSSPGQIAIVDDDPGVCLALSRLLRSAGHRCAVYGSAEMFLELGAFEETDCMLLDIRMPGMSGLDFHLSLNGEMREIPIIYITGDSEDSLRERALLQGAAAFFAKPFDDADVLSAIEEILDGSGSRGRNGPEPDGQ